MKSPLFACLFAGLCASASASGFNASILSHITFDQPWRDLDAWFAYIDTAGDGAYSATPWDSQMYGASEWSQRTMLGGTAGDGINSGSVAGSVEIYTVFWFDFGGEGGSLNFTHTRAFNYVNAWGSASASAFDSILFDGVETDQTSFDNLTAWHSVQLTTRVEGRAAEDSTARVPDSGSTVGLLSIVLLGCAHQFQMVARRSRARAGTPLAA
jgi:hypothetical protein